MMIFLQIQINHGLWHVNNSPPCLTFFAAAEQVLQNSFSNALEEVKIFLVELKSIIGCVDEHLRIAS